VRFSRFRRCASREEEEDEEVEVEAPLNDVVVECQKHLFPGSAGGDGPSQRARAKEEETEVEVAAAAAAEEEEAKEKKPRRSKDEATLRIFFIGVKRIKKKVKIPKRRVEIFTKNTRESRRGRRRRRRRLEERYDARRKSR